jgi:hypothetical protein
VSFYHIYQIDQRAKNEFIPRRAGAPELLERFNTQGSQAGSRERSAGLLGLVIFGLGEVISHIQ